MKEFSMMGLTAVFSAGTNKDNALETIGFSAYLLMRAIKEGFAPEDRTWALQQIVRQIHRSLSLDEARFKK